MIAKRLASLAAAAAFGIWAGGAQAADIDLTGDVSLIDIQSFNVGTTHYDVGLLSLSDFDPFVVSVGDTFTVGVTLNGLLNVPASGTGTTVELLLSGDQFPSIITETYGTLTLTTGGLDGPSETIDQNTGIGSSSQLVTEVNLGPNVPAFGFDGMSASFTAHGFFSDPDTPFTGSVSLDNATIRYTVTSAAVPEPAAWALMLVGFGGLGATLRARRRRAFA